VLIKNFLCSMLVISLALGLAMGLIIKVFRNVLVFLGLGTLVELPGKEWDWALEVAGCVALGF
jgi:hypothetical protein